jgi:hypothetical protein
MLRTPTTSISKSANCKQPERGEQGVSRALSAIDSIEIDRPGSTADFEKWSMAAAPAFGWKPAEFQTADRKNQTVVVDDRSISLTQSGLGAFPRSASKTMSSRFFRNPGGA